MCIGTSSEGRGLGVACLRGDLGFCFGMFSDFEDFRVLGIRELPEKDGAVVRALLGISRDKELNRRTP